MIRHALIEPFLLANSPLLGALEKIPLGGGPLDPEDLLRQLVFHGFRACHYAMPDHVFKCRWEGFAQESGAREGHWVVPVLRALADRFLELHDQRAKVKFKRFDLWQTVISRISSLPLRSALYAREAWRSEEELKPLVRREMETSFFLTPYSPVVEDYIQREGLCETHLHLNGSTPAEYAWLLLLRDPRRELQKFFSAYKDRKKTVKELCRCVDEGLTPEKVLDRCHLARQLRAMLMGRVGNGGWDWMGSGMDGWPLTPRSLVIRRPFALPCEFHRDCRSMLRLLACEASWQARLIRELERRRDPLADRIFHLYLLIKHQYLQLLVQREDLYGFDEFQKVTKDDLRRSSEKEYLERFRQFHGPEGRDSDVLFLEGRFAPRGKLGDAEEQMRKILSGYLAYLRQEKREEAERTKRRSLSSLLDALDDVRPTGARQLRLALVAHFIKRGWDPKTEDRQHLTLRKSLLKEALVLRVLLRRHPRLKTWIRGIDAASNEMAAPPEVFAPIFRICRRFGIEHATYHVGEDFLHLIGGIRQVDDALRFLGLQAGDRLGHCTAVGIDPRFWLDTMPETIMVRKDDWMLDLLSVWRQLGPVGGKGAFKAANEAVRLGNEIFDESLSIEELDRTMALRDLYQEYVFRAVNEGDKWAWQLQSLDDDLREEARRIGVVLGDGSARNGKRLLFRLCRWWGDPTIRDRRGKYESVPSKFLNEEELLRYQQAVLGDIRNRNLVMESLPTSNVRISQYDSVRQHHIFRWMNMPGKGYEEDPAVMVSLGSDDPGIFATSLKGEFYHLYSVLRHDYGLSDCEAIRAVGQVNERGRIFRFHP